MMKLSHASVLLCLTTAALAQTVPADAPAWLTNLIAADAQSKLEPTESNAKRFADSLQIARDELAKLPDGPRKSELTEIVDNAFNAYRGRTLDSRASAAVKQLDEQIAQLETSSAGWREEPAANWAEFRELADEKTRELNAPKTIAVRKNADELMAALEKSDDFSLVANAPSMQASLKRLGKLRADADAQLIERATLLVQQAVESDVRQPQRLLRLKDAIRTALGEQSAAAVKLQSELQTKADAFDAQNADNEGIREQRAAKLATRANEVWPSLRGEMEFTKAIDLKQNDATIYLATENLIGARYKLGTERLIGDIDGQAVIFRFPPELTAAMNAIEQQIARPLGSVPADGKWEIVAKITAQTLAVEYREPTEPPPATAGDYPRRRDARVLDVQSVRIGPFAGDRTRGSLTPEGTLSTPGPSTEPAPQ